MNAKNVITELTKKSHKDKAAGSMRFFKTGKGQYGEGDIFIGVTVPELKVVAKKYKDLDIKEVEKLLHSKIHEERQTSLFILRNKYLESDQKQKKAIADLYYKNRKYINNWDLVDCSAPYIYGDYLKNTNYDILFKLAKSDSLWDRRIAIVSTFAFIKDKELELTLKISDLLLYDDQDLIHKAVGWALREAGKKDKKTLLGYLDKNYRVMPRTTLRYAIERLAPDLRKHYLAK